MPRHLISDAHEWINEIPTVPAYYLAKPQPQQDTKMRSTLYGVINKYLDVQYIRVSDDKQNSGLNNYSTMSIEAFKEIVC